MNTRDLFLLVAFLLFALQSCEPVDSFPDKLVPLEGEIEEVEINPPCSYNNYVELEGENGMKGNNSLSVNENSERVDFIFRFAGSPNTVNIRYTNSFALERIKSEVIDFSKKSNYGMYVVFWDATIRARSAISGKLYIEVLSKNEIKFTWCDVTMLEISNNLEYTCKGSYVVKH
jgi:hypothetical protein